jgi:hypothetical protein
MRTRLSLRWEHQKGLHSGRLRPWLQIFDSGESNKHACSPRIHDAANYTVVCNKLDSLSLDDTFACKTLAFL